MEARDVLKYLTEYADSKNLFGVSARHLDLPHNAFIVGTPENYIPFFDAKIVDYSGKTMYYEENDPSLPGIFCKVKRWHRIRVRYKDVNDNVKTEIFEGVTAMLIQHQVDYLQGINFLDKATKYHREKALKDKKLLDRKKRRNNVKRLV